MSKKNLLTTTSVTTTKPGVDEHLKSFALDTPQEEAHGFLHAMFSKAAALPPAPDITERVYQKSAILSLGFILKSFLGQYTGLNTPFVDCNYYYEEKGKYHCFEMYPQGENPDDPDDESGISPMMQALRHTIRRQITEFLEELDQASDYDHMKINPESGVIFFDRKIDLYKCMNLYLKDNDVHLIDIRDWTFTVQQTIPEFEHVIAEHNIRSEMAGIFREQAVRCLLDDPYYADTLLLSATSKPYADLKEYMAQTKAMADAIDQDIILLSSHFAILEEQIRLEDGGNADFDLGLNWSHPHVRPTLN